jgi:hypothetical protein
LLTIRASHPSKKLDFSPPWRRPTFCSKSAQLESIIDLLYRLT